MARPLRSVAAVRVSLTVTTAHATRRGPRRRCSWWLMVPGTRSAASGRRRQHVEQRAHADARPALAQVRIFLLAEGGPGDVEVRPAHAVAHEFLQEQAGRDRPAPADARV